MHRTADPDLAIPNAALVCGALDGMCVGLVLTNAAGRVAWANRSAQAMLGFDLADGCGRPLTLLLRDPNMAEFWHRAAEVDDISMGEVCLRWPAPRQLKVNASTCRDPGGCCTGRALLFCDVTQERSLQVHLSAAATQRLLDMAEPPPASAAPHTGMTPQELRILRLVGRGLGNKQIALAMHIAATTVRTHLKHVYGKLGLGQRSEAISYAVRHGLV